MRPKIRLLLLSLISPAALAQVIQDGDFDSPDYTPGQFFLNSGDTFGAWTVDSTWGFIIHDDPGAQSGGQIMSLTSPFGSPEGVPGGFTHRVRNLIQGLSAGIEYRIQFYSSGSSTDLFPDISLNASISGSSATYNYLGSSSGSSPWVLQTIDFVAGSSSEYLYIETTRFHENVTARVDSFSISQIPEPGTSCAFMGLVSGLLVLNKRRSRVQGTATGI